jgi:hypothetical protein
MITSLISLIWTRSCCSTASLGSRLATAAAQARQIAANDDARCQSYGAKPGSDAYVSCRMNIDNQRNANAHAADPAVMQYLLRSSTPRLQTGSPGTTHKPQRHGICYVI